MLWEKNTVTAINAQSNGGFSDITSVSESEFKELKRLYNECEDDGIFKFQGKDIYKIYAKYLIEYLDGKFADN